MNVRGEGFSNWRVCMQALTMASLSPQVRGEGFLGFDGQPSTARCKFEIVGVVMIGRVTEMCHGEPFRYGARVLRARPGERR